MGLQSARIVEERAMLVRGTTRKYLEQLGIDSAVGRTSWVEGEDQDATGSLDEAQIPWLRCARRVSGMFSLIFYRVLLPQSSFDKLSSLPSLPAVEKKVHGVVLLRLAGDWFFSRLRSNSHGLLGAVCARFFVPNSFPICQALAHADAKSLFVFWFATAVVM